MRVKRATASGAALVLLGGILGAAALATPASAALTGATPTSTTEVVAGAATTLTGLGVSADAAEAVSVTIATTRGQLAVDTGTGITLAYGYGSTGAEVAFSGTGAEVNAALGSLALSTSLADNGGTATISLMARSASAAVYAPSTGHFYEFVSSPGITWAGAQAAAASQTLSGQSGYLATIPDAAVNALIASRISGAQKVWVGGQAADVGGNRIWTWRTGPLTGAEFSLCSSTAYNFSCDFTGSGGAYQSWAYGEPNNWDDGYSNVGESFMVTNWNGSNGQWNDLPGDTYGISGYVVEYGDLAYGASTAFSGVYAVSSTVTVVGVPSAPTSVTAAEGLGQVSVSFGAPTSDGGAAVDGYRVTPSPSGAAADCAGSPCVVTGLTAGQAHTFAVQAHNTHGWSPSASTAATPGSVPGAPTGVPTVLVVGAAPGATVAASGYPAPSYSVTAGSLPPGVSLNGVTGALSGAPSATGAWSVEITATNAYGTALTTFAGATESIPSVSTATFGALTWSVPADVTLVASATPAATWSVTGGSLPAGLVLDASGRLHGTPTVVGAYSATVTATNSHGTSVMTYTGNVAALPPTAPTEIAVQPDDGSISVAFSPPSSTGGSPITAYEYTLDHGTTWSVAPFGELASPIVIGGLTNGTAYTVQLRAVNVAGGGAASGDGTGTPRTVPSNPAITSVTSGNSSLSVAFTVPTSDGGSPVIGYRYSLDGGGTWSADVTAATASPMVIYGLINGMSYQVTICAVSAAGNGVQSHLVSGTPDVAPIEVPDGGAGGTALPELDPGLAGVLVNGGSVAISSGASGDGWRMATSGTTVAFEALDADGALVPVFEGSASFEGIARGSVLVTGSGFKPGTTADIWLFSTPVLLGVPTVQSDGTFSAMLALPRDTPLGQHTIQVNGVTADSETLSASLGVRVVSARSTLASTGADVRLFPAALLVGLGVALLAAARGRERRACV